MSPLSVAANQINFVQQSRRKLHVLQERDGSILKISLIVFSFVGVVCLFALGYWQYLRLELSEIKGQQEQQERILTQVAQDEARYLLYTAQLSLIDQVLSSRSSRQPAMEFLSQLTFSGLSFRGISFAELDKTISFQIEAEDVFIVDQFVERVRSPQIQSQLEDIEVSDVRRDGVGQYTLQVKLKLREGETS